MKYAFQTKDSSLLVLFSGTLNSLELPQAYWDEVQVKLSSNLITSKASQIFIDLRNVLYVDSRAIFNLYELGQIQAQISKFAFIGPGEGILRSEELSDTPELKPMLHSAPWENPASALGVITSALDRALETRESQGAAATNKTVLQNVHEDAAVAISKAPAQKLLDSIQGNEENENHKQPASLSDNSGSDQGKDSIDPFLACLDEALDQVSSLCDSGESAITGRVQTDSCGPDEEVIIVADMDSVQATSTPDGLALNAGVETQNPVQDFEVDLDAEERLLASRSDQRDEDYSVGPLELKANWNQIEAGEEYVQRRPAAQSPKIALENAIGSLLEGTSATRAAIDSGVSRATEPRAVKNEKPDQSTLSQFSSQEGLNPVSATSEIEQDFRQRAQEQSESVLSGIQSLLGRLGTEQQRYDRLVLEYQKALQEKQELHQAVEEARQESKDQQASHQQDLRDMQARAQDQKNLIGQWAWLQSEKISNTDLHGLRAMFCDSLREFNGPGRVDPHQLLKLASCIAQRSTSIACSLNSIVRHELVGYGANRWSAMLLLLSTMAREGASFGEICAATRNAILASLLDYSPSAQPTRGQSCEQLEESLKTLLQSSQYQFDEEQVVSPQDFCALWRSCLRLTSYDSLLDENWQEALFACEASMGSSSIDRAGLARVLSAHSLYLPGSWVLLSNGGIGPVLGGSGDRPDLPKVLILYRQDKEKIQPEAPSLFPGEAQSVATVVRLISPPAFQENINLSDISLQSNSAISRPCEEETIKLQEGVPQ